MKLVSLVNPAVPLMRAATTARTTAFGALLVAIGAAGALVPNVARAQAFNYPSLQLPTASTRDYTAAIAGGRGTTALFQWREGAGAGMHLGLDAGIADPPGSGGLVLFVGGSGGKELLRASGDQPLDLLGTVGVGVAFGSGNSLVRVPVGVSIGHTFPLDEGMSITPYVHPRVSLDILNGRATRSDNSEVTLNFDLGANLQVNKQFALRVAGVFSGSDQYGSGNAFTVGFNWTPSALARSVSRGSR